MNSFKTVIIIVFLILSCKTEYKVSGMLKDDLVYILKSGKFHVDIYESVFVKDKQLEEINRKLSIAICENKEWFIQYTLAHPESLPYNEKFGVSESEYIYYLGHSRDMIELKKSGEEVLEINHINDRITFNGTGVIDFMDMVEINLKDSTIFMVENTLHFDRFIVVDSSNNVFESTWKGYRWEFAEGVNANNITSDSFNMKYYSITIGYLEGKQKSFIILEGKQIEKGKSIVDFYAPVILNNP